MNQFWIQSLRTIVGSGTPLLIAALGEMITEKSGVVNLSLDGSLLLSSLVGFVIASHFGVAWGVIAACITGCLMAFLLAFQTIRRRQSQTMVGYVLMMLGIALSDFLGQPFVMKPGPYWSRTPLPILSQVPVIGEIFFNQSLFVYLSLLLVAVCWFWLEKTRHGLELRAIGENPESAFRRGIPVNKLRFLYTLVGGCLVGLAGASYSLGIRPGWTRGHTLGEGWLALALVIFGGWNPIRVLLGAYLFASLTSASGLVQKLIPGLPPQLSGVAPYTMMIIALMFVQNRSVFKRYKAPEALGKPFKE